METWDTLVPVIMQYLQNNHEHNLKQLFLMIKETLVLSEVGVLGNVEEGFDELSSLNSWLISTTIQALMKSPNDEGMTDAVVQLQSEILSASLVKNLPLLRVLIDKLLLFIEEVINKLLGQEFPAEVSFEKAKAHRAKPLVKLNIKENVITINNVKEIYAVLTAQLQVFTQVCSLTGDSHPDVIAKVSEMFMKVFVYKNTPMSTKIDVLKFFTGILKNNLNVTEAQLDHVITIINCFGKALSYKVIWTTACDDKYDWNTLFMAMKAFLKEVLKIKRGLDDEFIKCLITGLESWIINGCQCLLENKENIWTIRQLVILSKKCLIKISDDADSQFLDQKTLIKFLDYLELVPELSSLLSSFLTNELQSPHERPVFTLLIKKLEEVSKKTNSITAFETLEPFEATLSFWKEVFCLIRNTNDSLISQSQQNFIKNHQKLPDKPEIYCFDPLKSLETIFTSVVTNLLDKVAKTQLSLTSHFMAVVLLDFAYAGLNSLSELNLISEEVKLHLVYLLLSPFCKMGQGLSGKFAKNVTKFYEDENQVKQRQIAILSKSLNLFFNLNLKAIKNPEVKRLATSVLDYVMNSSLCDGMQDECIKLLPIILVNSDISVEWLEENIFNPSLNAKKYQQILGIFVDLVAVSKMDAIVVCSKSPVETNEYLIISPSNLVESECTCVTELESESVGFVLEKIKKRHGMLISIPLTNQDREILDKIIEKYIPIVLDAEKNYEIQAKLLQMLPQLVKSVGFMLQEAKVSYWIKILSTPDPKVMALVPLHIKSIINQVKSRLDLGSDENLITKAKFLYLFQDELIKAVTHAFKSKDKDYQENVLLLLQNYTTTKNVTEPEILDCFRFALRFLLKSTSKVKFQAYDAVRTISWNFNVRPLQILNWYRMLNIRFVMDIVATNYCQSNILMMETINELSKLLGFARSTDFVIRYHKMMIAVLFPLILKSRKCEDILNEISSICNRSVESLLKVSFSLSYPFVYVKHSPTVARKCIEYMQNAFGPDILSETVFQSEISVSDILIYYHSNPKCVLDIFNYYQATSGLSNSEPLNKLSEYLGCNILGVLKHFETNIDSQNSDKIQKNETMLSLGQIIRLIGTERITPYRFKIMTILNTAMETNDRKMIEICIKVWHIFVHTVDMMELGQLLSAIIVSLKPFIEDYPVEIDEIFTYLIVENSNLMSKYFTDIFFLDELPIREELKRAIDSKQHSSNQRKAFLEQLDEYLTHIRHKNVVVRAYGLKYLRNVLRKNRTELNNLIVNDAVIHPILGGLLRNLMICCKENDEDIQKFSAECIGELGALEPSHLPPDYQPQSGFAFSIHTTEFAKLALEKLCHAYQIQSDVKHVDCFALAIQEVLVSNDVDPSQEKNLQIWKALPMKMQTLIKPLLNSSYTTMRKKMPVDLHPIYGSSEARTCVEWAWIWARKIIEQISKVETKSLLDAFTPSIKRDAQILSMIFPYIILHAILASNSKAQNEIVDEMTTVLEDILNPKSQQGSMDSQDELLKANQISMTSERFYTQSSTIQARTEENMRLKCSKIVFGILDFLERYLNELVLKYSRAHEKEDYKLVKQFIEKFDYKMLAKANFECEEYARALWYIEQYINYDSGSRLQGELGFLAKIHAELLDPDSVEGAMAVKVDEPTLEEQILTYNVTGRLHESAVCFERIMQLQKNNPTIMKDMVGCYLGLDQPETALLVSETFYSKFADDNPDLVLQANCAEPLWRLSRWDELEQLIQEPGVKESDIWGINCGKLLIDFRASKHEEFDEEINSIRLSLLRVLKTHESEQSIYQKCYSQILKLHMLTEIQKAEEIMRQIGTQVPESSIGRILNNMLSDWASRNELLQPTSHIMEPLLCLRRIILNEMQQLFEVRLEQMPRAVQTVKKTINESIGKLWVQSTQLASKAKMFQQAALYIFNAEKYKPPELYIEKAKLSWEKGDQTNALKVLDTGINDTMQAIRGDIRVLNAPDLKLFAEARLLVAVFNSESAKFSPDFNLKCFKECIETYSQQEKGYFLYAQYFERVHDNLDPTYKSKRTKPDYLVNAMVYYGKSLMFGCNYIYQSMPRLLTIWLDYTAKKDELASKMHMQQLNQYMQRYMDTLPTFMFFTAFSQLVSRICHPNQETYTILKSILINLIKAYPQQSLWMFLGVYKSTYEIRVKRCKEILNDKRLASNQKFIWTFNELTEQMINLTNAELSAEEERSRTPNGTVHTKISTLYRPFLSFFQTHKNAQIMMPIQEQMSIIKPPSRDRDKPADHHNPFPNEPIYIQGVLDNVTVLSSLQKPKKITLIGSNGRHYDILMKPKDDPRKDFRLMEFNNVIKQLLYEDTDARQRRLHIRTYTVLPLNDETGLIEWVQNVTPYRNIVMHYYKQLGKGLSMRDLKNKYPQKRESIEKKKQFFESYLLPNHPLVFADWFRERFPNPHDWYQARCGYVKTLAVMSMVGYVIGLGDRHGENILMDGSCGDVLHVDFSCLFNKGELFEVPEVVPFRLTHNMVKAMGPLGVDGLFRKCCEITMRTMQNQQNTLMSVLRPFVYDPLVSWTKTTSKAQLMNQERTDPQAEENLKQIEYRLKGYVKIDGKRSAAPLSTVGQVNHCITEATNVANLAAMYIGWGSYL